MTPLLVLSVESYFTMCDCVHRVTLYLSCIVIQLTYIIVIGLSQSFTQERKQIYKT